MHAHHPCSGGRVILNGIEGWNVAVRANRDFLSHQARVHPVHVRVELRVASRLSLGL